MISLTETGWHDRAACIGAGDLFYPDGTTGQAAESIAMAKDICRECPVQRECLDYSLSRPEKYGIWAGVTEDERKAMRREADIDQEEAA